MKDMTMIYYFSDGPALQHKHGRERFRYGWVAFFATSHAKGVCEGTGRITKRVA
jgi:hypothetical protein